jgi:hypothetical protein
VPRASTLRLISAKNHRRCGAISNGYELRLLRDDGAVVYINGAEVLRDNMPTGTITSTTTALTSLGDGEEIIWKSVTIAENRIE